MAPLGGLLRAVGAASVAFSFALWLPEVGFGDLLPPSVRNTPRDGVTTCLRPAGEGRLALLERAGAGASLVLVDATRTPPAPPPIVGRVRVGELSDCPDVASGGGVTAAAAFGSRNVRVGLLDRGRASVETLRDSGEIAAQVSVAVGPDGGALAVWAERRESSPSVERVRILAAFRPAGGRFGAPHPLDGPAPSRDTAAGAITVKAVGEGFLAAWAGGRAPRGARVVAARFDRAGVVQERWTVAPDVATVMELALAAAPDGRAVLAVDDGDGLLLSERDPGGAFPAARRYSVRGARPTVAINARGEALVGWIERSVVAIARRPAGGTFGPPQRVPGRPRGSDFVGLPGVFSGFPDDLEEERHVDLAIDDEGRALAAWLAPAAGIDPLPRARVAVAEPGGAFVRRDPFDFLTLTRGVNGVAALTGPGGRPAAAWTDHLTIPTLGGRERPQAAGQLHLTTETSGAVTVLPVFAPRIRSISLPRQRLNRIHGPMVRVRCDRPCDVRVVGRSLSGRRLFAAGRRLRRGSGRFLTEPVDRPTWPPAKLRRVRIDVTATQPYGGSAATARTTLRVRPRR